MNTTSQSIGKGIYIPCKTVEAFFDIRGPRFDIQGPDMIAIKRTRRKQSNKIAHGFDSVIQGILENQSLNKHHRTFEYIK